MWELSEHNRPISHGYGYLPSLKLIQGLPCPHAGIKRLASGILKMDNIASLSLRKTPEKDHPWLIPKESAVLFFVGGITATSHAMQLRRFSFPMDVMVATY